MKTIVLYNDLENPIRMMIVEGDFTRFHGLVINAGENPQLQDEFCAWFFDEEGGFNFELSEDIKLLEDKNWDKVAFTTFFG